MKHIFIVNTISGKHINEGILDELKGILSELNIDYEIIMTDHANHPYEIAKNCKDADTCLYAMGGDGTLYEVLNGMDIKLTLGIIPRGSGNDFYRMFKKEDLDFKELITKTTLSKERVIDYATFNDRRFINTLSIGIDAMVNYDASKLIRKSFITKGPAYILSIIKNIIIPKTTKLNITIDDKKYSGEYFIVAIMNGKYYGNGRMAAPSAEVDDGYLDIVLAPKCSIIHLYPKLIKYLKGRHENDPYFKILKAKKITIDSDKTFVYQSDGENYNGNSVDIKIIEHGIKIKMGI